METTQGYRPSVLEAAALPNNPLCTEIMNRTGSAQDVATEIASRLYALKDRLFGPEPTNAAGSGPPDRVTPSAFADAYSDRAERLHRTLCNIDALTNELNNRL